MLGDRAISFPISVHWSEYDKEPGNQLRRLSNQHVSRKIKWGEFVYFCQEQTGQLVCPKNEEQNFLKSNVDSKFLLLATWVGNFGKVDLSSIWCHQILHKMQYNIVWQERPKTEPVPGYFVPDFSNQWRYGRKCSQCKEVAYDTILLSQWQDRANGAC